MLLLDAVRKLSRSLRREGLTVTVRKVVSLVREPLFDLCHGTDTNGRVEISSLDVSGANVENAIDYEPTSHHELRNLLRRLRLPGGTGVFVDFGSGKGRVLLLATKYSFDRIVGVEFSAQLCEVARTNVQKFCPDDGRVEILNQDAAEYRFRDDETIFFLYNPFREAVMQAVVDNIGESLRRRPRPVWVIYSNPRRRSVLESSGLFSKVDEIRMPRTRAVVYRNHLYQQETSRQASPERAGRTATAM